MIEPIHLISKCFHDFYFFTWFQSRNLKIRRNMDTPLIPENASTRRNMDSPLIPKHTSTSRSMYTPLIPENASRRDNKVWHLHSIGSSSPYMVSFHEIFTMKFFNFLHSIDHISLKIYAIKFYATLNHVPPNCDTRDHINHFGEVTPLF